MDLTRRQVLGAGGAAAGLAVAGGSAARGVPEAAPFRGLPAPADSGLDHIVVVMMENRSFDHYLGWLPGADGRQAGLKYRDDEGKVHLTHHLTDFRSCGYQDPDHSYKGGRVQLNGGKCDGFRKGRNDELAIGYYLEKDLAAYGPLVRNFTTFDRYFCSLLTQTYPNRFYSHSAATDRLVNNFDITDMVSIWDRLDEAGVSAGYFFSDLPFIGLYGPEKMRFARPYASFLALAAAGQLPSYSYVEPSFLGAGQGFTNDDHPAADIRRGQAFVSQIANAVMNSPQWERTALVITYDEWGGFFDHVRPPRLPDDHARPVGAPDDHSQAGFRVPTIVVSPFARRGYVGHNVYDHTSILKMAEWRWGLKPMTKRDAAARNLAESFRFDKPDFSVPDLPTVVDPGPYLCGDEGSPLLNHEPTWEEYAASPALKDWRL